MKPAIFLDRDGVLCVEKSYVTSLDELEIFSYTKGCIEEMHQKGFLTICITNQSAIARGILAESELQKMNAYLIDQTGLDAVYYCPHHPTGREPYNVRCSCRKPGIGMIQQAAKEWRIDLSGSYMVGDRASDIICGQNAGLKTVLLESGYGTERLEQKVQPDRIYKDLKLFVKNLK